MLALPSGGLDKAPVVSVTGWGKSKGGELDSRGPVAERDEADPRESPLVSVVIPAQNSEAFIGRAIRSVLNQTYRPYEIVVVDDGSSDGTREMVESFQGPIRYVYQERSGAASARNRGIQESRGEILAFLDSDDEWLPERLEKTVSPMLENPSVGLSYCRFVHVFADGTRKIGHEDAVRHRRPSGIYPPPYVCTPTSTLRRECFHECGLFDTALVKFEDFDLFVRVAEQYEVHGIDEALVIVNDRPNSLSHSIDPETGTKMLLRYVFKALCRDNVHREFDGALSEAYLSAGLQFLSAWRSSRARRYFLVSFLLAPSWRSFQFVLRTLLPKPVLKVARWMRARSF